MDEYRVPSVDVLVDYVKQYDRRVGLRMLYGRYNIPKHERDKYRELWAKFHAMLPDSFEKEPTEERIEEDGSDVRSESGHTAERIGERDREENPVCNNEHA